MGNHVVVARHRRRVAPAPTGRSGNARAACLVRPTATDGPPTSTATRQSLAGLGTNAIRHTIEWARIEPRIGYVDHGRIEHERHVLQAIRAAGLQPWVTLQHGTLPGWFLDDERGWRDDKARRTHWPRHVDRCAEAFEDLVAGWVPIEDPDRLGHAWLPVGHSPTRVHESRTCPRGHHRRARRQSPGVETAQGWGRAGDVRVGAHVGSRRRRSNGRTEAHNWDTVMWDVFLRARREGVLDVPGGASLDRQDMAGSFDCIGIAYKPPLLVERRRDDRALSGDRTVRCHRLRPNPEELGEVMRRLAELAPRCPIVVAADGVATTDDDWRDELLRATVLETAPRRARRACRRRLLPRDRHRRLRRVGFDAPRPHRPRPPRQDQRPAPQLVLTQRPPSAPRP